MTSDGTRSTGVCAPAGSPSQEVGEQVRCSAPRPRQRLADAGEPDAPARPGCRRSRSTARRRRSPTARSAPSASESLAQTSAVGGSVGPAGRPRTARPASTPSWVRRVERRAGQPAPRPASRAQPARRSSPTPEPARPAEEADPPVAGLEQVPGGRGRCRRRRRRRPTGAGRPARPTAGRTSRTARRARPATSVRASPWCGAGRARRRRGRTPRAGRRTWRSRPGRRRRV